MFRQLCVGSDCKIQMKGFLYQLGDSLDRLWRAVMSLQRHATAGRLYTRLYCPAFFSSLDTRKLTCKGIWILLNLVSLIVKVSWA